MTPRSVLFLLPALLLAGCVSSIKVQKVPAGESPTADDKAKKVVAGLRYSLPAAFVVVEPNPAVRGGYSVETRLFPNQEETYAIQAATYGGSLKFDVDLEDGMLKKVTLNQDDSALTGQATTALGEIVKADLEQRAEEKKKAEEAAKAKKTKLEELQKDVRNKEDALAVAQRSVEEWQRLVNVDGENEDYQLGLRKARVELTSATIALQRANEALTDFLAGSGDAASGTSATETQDNASTTGSSPAASGTPPAPPPPAPPSAPATPPAPPAPAAPPGSAAPPPGAAKPPAKPSTTTPMVGASRVAGPVFYRVVDTCDPWRSKAHFSQCEVKLVPADWKPETTDVIHQIELPTAKVPPPPGDQPEQPELVIQQASPEPVHFVKGLFTRSLAFERSICGLDAESSELLRLAASDADDDLTLDLDQHLGVELGPGKAQLNIRLKEGNLDPGSYVLTIAFTWGAKCKKQQTQPGTVAYRFRIEKMAP